MWVHKRNTSGYYKKDNTETDPQDTSSSSNNCIEVVKNFSDDFTANAYSTSYYFFSKLPTVTSKDISVEKGNTNIDLLGDSFSEDINIPYNNKNNNTNYRERRRFTNFENVDLLSDDFSNLNSNVNFNSNIHFNPNYNENLNESFIENFDGNPNSNLSNLRSSFKSYFISYCKSDNKIPSFNKLFGFQKSNTKNSNIQNPFEDSYFDNSSQNSYTTFINSSQISPNLNDKIKSGSISNASIDTNDSTNSTLIIDSAEIIADAIIFTSETISMLMAKSAESFTKHHKAGTEPVLFKTRTKYKLHKFAEVTSQWRWISYDAACTLNLLAERIGKKFTENSKIISNEFRELTGKPKVEHQSQIASAIPNNSSENYTDIYQESIFSESTSSSISPEQYKQNLLNTKEAILIGIPHQSNGNNPSKFTPAKKVENEKLRGDLITALKTTGNIMGQTLIAMNVLLAAVEEAENVVLESFTDSGAKIAGHKYGPDAHVVAKDVGELLKNAVLFYFDSTKLTRKALLKSCGRGLAVDLKKSKASEFNFGIRPHQPRVGKYKELQVYDP